MLPNCMWWAEAQERHPGEKGGWGAVQAEAARGSCYPVPPPQQGRGLGAPTWWAAARGLRREGSQDPSKPTGPDGLRATPWREGGECRPCPEGLVPQQRPRPHWLIWEPKPMPVRPTPCGNT